MLAVGDWVLEEAAAAAMPAGVGFSRLSCVDQQPQLLVLHHFHGRLTLTLPSPTKYYLRRQQPPPPQSHAPNNYHCRQGRRALLWGSSFLFISCAESLARAELEEEDDLYAVEEQRLIHLFQEVTRSVVSIQDIEILNPKAEKGSAAYEDFKLEGTGSGFIWDQLGHIVTNFHVVAKLAADSSRRQRSNVSLLANDGTVSVYEAKLLGIDPLHDLAVLKIDATENCLQPLPIGMSLDLRVGQNCYAIGNPYGLEHTLTSGVISGLGREIPSPVGKPILGAIQTDASINAGNSGGPLLDSFGRVIGVSTATFTRQGTGVSSGVNFALPIDLVRGLIPYLIVYGTNSSLKPHENLTLTGPSTR